MSRSYELPPKAAEIRAVIEERLREAVSAEGSKETVTVDWRGQPKHVEVIDLPIDLMYYNPATHRIRAQRSHNLALEQGLESDPWSTASQDYLHFLLCANPANPSEPDPDLKALVESLDQEGQAEPGLITRDGILVNGNTRRAALKNLGKRSIRVGVLPESCTWEDINQVELSLQLRPDKRRDYSYVNRMLAYEEMIAAGVPEHEVARQFRTTVKMVKGDLKILSLIYEMVDRSAHDGASLRLVDFERAQENLRDYGNAVAQAKTVEEAELIKESKMVAIVLDFSKTDVRLIEHDFKERYLDPRLPDPLKEPQAAVAPVAIPGLGRTSRAASPKVAAARAFNDRVLRAKAEIVSGSAVSSQQAEEARQVYTAAREAVEEALKPAAGDARYKKKKLAPSDRIEAACSDIQQCISDLAYARASRSLDDEAAETFDDSLLELKKLLGKLAGEAHRSFSDGEGLDWLIAVGRMP
ncbi:transcriptional regulator [Actinospica durhamensis]|uniref:Transcriptional regulator n=1 Tax=Actinospica durhamensis TaxID=1508375 RepID=A0A941ETY6_9ACTN|nr:ParB N-terminal domain-containing protein [Actinospica durhamensis]MBR7833824.1 transcriptional regulator [Actinospica durhamensis]